MDNAEKAYRRHMENVQAQEAALRNARSKLEAATEALNNSGALIEHKTIDAHGRVITSYTGDIAATFAPFTVKGIPIRIRRPGT